MKSSHRLRPQCFCKIYVGLDTQGHDRVDNIVVVLFQGFDGLIAADVGLGHDEFDVLILDALGVNLFAVILFLFLLLGLVVVVVAVASLAVVVTGVLGLSGGSELLSGSGLGSGVDVLDLGLTENTALNLLASLFHLENNPPC